MMLVRLDEKASSPQTARPPGMHVPGGRRGDPFVLSSADTCMKVPGPRGEPGARTLGIVLRTRP